MNKIDEDDDIYEELTRCQLHGSYWAKSAGGCPMCWLTGTTVEGDGAGAAAQEQPLPTAGAESVTDALIDLLRARQKKGIQTYGRSLETFNGRDATQDLLEELIDACQYLLQVQMERAALFKALGNVFYGRAVYIEEHVAELQRVTNKLGWTKAIKNAN